MPKLNFAGTYKIRSELAHPGFYILCFEKQVDYPHAWQYGDGTHYVGMSIDIMSRIRRHRRGTKNSEAAKMAVLAKEQDISFQVGLMYSGLPSTTTERWLTQRCKEFCIYCNPDRNLAVLKQQMYLNQANYKDK